MVISCVELVAMWDCVKLVALWASMWNWTGDICVQWCLLVSGCGLLCETVWGWLLCGASLWNWLLCGPSLCGTGLVIIVFSCVARLCVKCSCRGVELMTDTVCIQSLLHSVHSYSTCTHTHIHMHTHAQSYTNIVLIHTHNNYTHIWYLYIYSTCHTHR